MVKEWTGSAKDEYYPSTHLFQQSTPPLAIPFEEEKNLHTRFYMIYNVWIHELFYNE